MNAQRPRRINIFKKQNNNYQEYQQQLLWLSALFSHQSWSKLSAPPSAIITPELEQVKNQLEGLKIYFTLCVCVYLSHQRRGGEAITFSFLVQLCVSKNWVFLLRYKLLYNWIHILVSAGCVLFICLTLLIYLMCPFSWNSWRKTSSWIAYSFSHSMSLWDMNFIFIVILYKTKFYKFSCL